MTQQSLAISAVRTFHERRLTVSQKKSREKPRSVESGYAISGGVHADAAEECRCVTTRGTILAAFFFG